MSLTAKIRAGLVAIFLFVVGALYVLLGIRTGQRDKAKNDLEKSKLETEKAVNAIKSHEKSKEQKEDIDEAIQESRNSDLSNVVERMRKRASDYHGNGE
ncbi:TMhelix containing protein [Vibrio phage 1.154.O._10N.222.52.B12]|nr:TMhelix containing protein [Vibrio phage 1.154.O._10N.222.52.B12]